MLVVMCSTLIYNIVLSSVFHGPALSLFMGPVSLQLAALQQSSLLRKVKRTLPSPPPEDTQLPMLTPNLSHILVPSLPSLKGSSRLAAKASLLKDLTHELKAVEQESTKLRKQQAELEEEEKEGNEGSLPLFTKCSLSVQGNGTFWKCSAYSFVPNHSFPKTFYP